MKAEGCVCHGGSFEMPLIEIVILKTYRCLVWTFEIRLRAAFHFLWFFYSQDQVLAMVMNANILLVSHVLDLSKRV